MWVYVCMHACVTEKSGLWSDIGAQPPLAYMSEAEVF